MLVQITTSPHRRAEMFDDQNMPGGIVAGGVLGLVVMLHNTCPGDWSRSRALLLWRSKEDEK